MGGRRQEEPWSLAAGWKRVTGGYRGVLRRKPLSGGRPATVRWGCDHQHDSIEAAVSCACIEKDNRWRLREHENAECGQGSQEAAKRCRKCGKLKPVTGFTCDRSKPDGRRNECRDCKHVVAKDYRDANQEAIAAKTAQWRSDDPERSRASSKRTYDGYRERVLDHYGRRCACCGNTDRLHIDHINGDGAAHREELFGDPASTGGGGMYRWLIKNGFPPGFQTLCERCNRSKGRGERCRIDHEKTPVAGIAYRPQLSSRRQWHAQYARVHLGSFATREEAIAARRAAELRKLQEASR